MHVAEKKYYAEILEVNKNNMKNNLVSTEKSS